MQHAGALECTERESPKHHQKGGEESPKADKGGSVGEYREGLPGLWETDGDVHLVLVPGTGRDGGG